jgi:hypothetical protein
LSECPSRQTFASGGIEAAMDGLTCPHGHEGPWYFVETRRLWWPFATVGNNLLLAPEPLDEEEVEDLPDVVSCAAWINDQGDACMAEVPLPTGYRVVRD